MGSIGFPSRERAYLLLEDGRSFSGVSLGDPGTAIGEVVFNTSMTGYQEVLTDPSYAGQLVTTTYPLVGNYGTNGQDAESARPQVAGFIVREASRAPSSWRNSEGLQDYLMRYGVVGIQDLDTRALTLHIRDRGAMRGAIAPDATPESELLERVRASPVMQGLNLAFSVSTDIPYSFPAQGVERYHVATYDLGVKAMSLRMLAARGCRITVLSAETPPVEFWALGADGLFLSNGPGDPAAVERLGATIREAAGRGIPVLGICLGHQLIARAFGGRTYKLPFGHHGSNHPVRNHRAGTVEITSQNHGFAVQGGEAGGIPGAPDLYVTHTNLYDGTIAGISHRSLPVLAVQYHPEAAPGPHDSNYLFDEFVGMMEEARGAT